MKFDDFLNFFKYYSDKPHQKEAIKILYDELDPKLKDDMTEWVRTYRKKEETTPSTTSVVCHTPYFSQRDNYRDASRTCFSSSCALRFSGWRSEPSFSIRSRAHGQARKTRKQPVTNLPSNCKSRKANNKRS